MLAHMSWVISGAMHYKDSHSVRMVGYAVVSTSMWEKQLKTNIALSIKASDQAQLNEPKRLSVCGSFMVLIIVRPFVVVLTLRRG